MIIKMNGEVLQDTFQMIPQDSILLTSIPSVPTVNLPELGNKFVEMGQEILIYGGMAMVVVSGLLMIVGLKKEGWRRLSSILQGLGVGLIGPSAVVLVAGFCLGISALLK